MLTTKGVKIEAGIYKIVNNYNNKCYVGQSSNCRNRCNNHMTKLRSNIHPNKHLQQAYNKYGEENFSFIVIEYCDVSDLNKKELYWIKKLKSNIKEFGYNIRLEPTVNRGVKWTEEQRKKFMESINKPGCYIRNHKIPYAVLEKAWEASRNRVWSKEDREKQSRLLKGLKVKDTTKMKIAQTGEGNGAHKLTKQSVLEIINLLNTGEYSIRAIAEVYKVSQSIIYSIKNLHSWKSIDRFGAIDSEILIKAKQKFL